MSEEEHQPNSPDRDEDLESLLRGLEPSALSVGLLSRLRRDYDRTVVEEAHEPRRPQWRHVIPLTLASCLVMLAYGLNQYEPRQPRAEGEAPPPAPAASSRTVAEAKPAPSEASAPSAADASTEVAGPTLDSFQPVSAQGYLVETSSEGVVETEEGLRERMNLEYRHAYHWHDPETGTNIRYFRPEKKERIVPLQTD